MGSDREPSYRGVFLPGDGVDFVVHNGGGPNSGAICTPSRRRPLIADIGRIVALDDPEWLVESNRSATFLSAKSLLE
jgi:hypothetical protein